MQLGLDMTRMLIPLTMVLVVACGPESDDEAAHSERARGRLLHPS